MQCYNIILILILYFLCFRATQDLQRLILKEVKGSYAILTLNRQKVSPRLLMLLSLLPFFKSYILNYLFKLLYLGQCARLGYV